MVERGSNPNLSSGEINKSIFENPAEGVLPEFVDFLKLAEREGAYGRLSPKRKAVVKYRIVDGMSQVRIAEEMKITKQAVSQTLKLVPRVLYKYMLDDISLHRTEIPFVEILSVYTNLVNVLDPGKKQTNIYFRCKHREKSAP